MEFGSVCWMLSAVTLMFNKSFHPHSQSEREEFESDYKQKYERERVLLSEENKKLSSELDKVNIHTLGSSQHEIQQFIYLIC